MYFLIGVLILVVFLSIVIISFKIRFHKIINQFGLQGMNLEDILKEAKLEDQDVPKSLSSMDRIYLEQIHRDFPNLNINELKRESERILLDCYHCIEKKDISGLRGMMKSFVNTKIYDYRDSSIHFDQMKIHNTVISNYKNENGISTICFATSFEYYLCNGDKITKTQDRCRTEFIYVYDESKVDEKKKVLGIHCPNCGSPISSLGEKNCSYCGGSVIELMKRVFTCNNIVQY